MGADPQAILFYGIPLPRLTVDYHELNDSWEQSYRPPQPMDCSDYRTPEWDEWRNRLQAWEATLENVRIAWSGADGCEKYYVHCAGLAMNVEWDELLPIEPASLSEVDSEAAKEMLHRFCDLFNIPKGEPGWHLAARYF